MIDEFNGGIGFDDDDDDDGLQVNGQNMLGVSHHHAVKVLCEAQTDIVMVVLRQRADADTTHNVNKLT